MSRDNQAAFLNDVLKGYQPAIDFVETLFGLSQQLDDLYDQDVAIDKRATLCDFAWGALCELPADEFYARHFAALHALVRAVMIDWMDANQLEGGDDDEKMLAFVLRDSMACLVTAVAGIVGGDNHMRAVSVRVRRHIHEDAFEDYASGLNFQEPLS